jgi:hypothetical protein
MRTHLEDGRNALLPPADNAAEVARAFERVRENPSLAGALAQEAFRDVHAWTWEKRAAAILTRFLPGWQAVADAAP